MKKIGYLRVSTLEQRPDRQIDGLRDICDELHVETVSAVAKRRPVYDRVVAQLEAGDAMVVWSLDRAFRSTVDAILEVEKLKTNGVAFEIVDLQIDTATPQGMLMFTVVSAFSQFEREVLKTRTKEGIASARSRGKRVGRPPKLSDADLDDALSRIQHGSTIRKVAEAFEVAPWSLTRSLKRRALRRPETVPGSEC